MAKKEEIAYTKVLVAKHSQENKCFVNEGEVLIVLPKQKLPLKDHVHHFFLSAKDQKTKSQYGWVKEVEEFTLDEFIWKYYKDPNQILEVEKEHIESMLNSIKSLKQETPVAATYSQRGVMEKKMVFKVHKVLFYDE